MSEFVTFRAANGMFTLDLHTSLVNGMVRAGALHEPLRSVLTISDAAQLLHWAGNCDNPDGQRADLARALAHLIRTAASLEVDQTTPSPPRTFWEAVSQ